MAKNALDFTFVLIKKSTSPSSYLIIALFYVTSCVSMAGKSLNQPLELRERKHAKNKDYKQILSTAVKLPSC